MGLISEDIVVDVLFLNKVFIFKLRSDHMCVVPASLISILCCAEGYVLRICSLFGLFAVEINFVFLEEEAHSMGVAPTLLPLRSPLLIISFLYIS